MKALALGLVKGLAIGFGIGLAFAIFDFSHHLLGTKLGLFALVGAATGLLCGAPFWRPGALPGSSVKAVTGAIVGVVLMALLYYLFDVEVGTRRLTSHYALVSAAWGALYGALVEWDDRRT